MLSVISCSVERSHSASYSGGQLLGNIGAVHRLGNLSGSERAGTLIPVHDALRVRGALLFRIDEGAGNDHVAISLGDDRTMEARGKDFADRRRARDLGVDGIVGAKTREAPGRSVHN